MQHRLITLPSVTVGATLTLNQNTFDLKSVCEMSINMFAEDSTAEFAKQRVTFTASAVWMHAATLLSARHYILSNCKTGASQ